MVSLLQPVIAETSFTEYIFSQESMGLLLVVDSSPLRELEEAQSAGLVAPTREGRGKASIRLRASESVPESVHRWYSLKHTSPPASHSF